MQAAVRGHVNVLGVLVSARADIHATLPGGERKMMADLDFSMKMVVWVGCRLGSSSQSSGSRSLEIIDEENNLVRGTSRT